MDRLDGSQRYDIDRVGNWILEEPIHFFDLARWYLSDLLPIFGFFAQGIHAGYALYFPELFPTHLRATGAGFCFNTGRIMAAPVLIWLSAELKRALDLRVAVVLLSTLFLVGLFVLPRLPETNGQELID